MPIKAKNIKAKNVSSNGVQFIGEADAETFKAAADAAEKIAATAKGDIEVRETLEADNVFEGGLQYIKDPNAPTLEELRTQFAALKASLGQDGDASSEIQAVLAETETELKEDKPEPSKLVQTLEKLSSTLKNVTDAAPNVLKVAKWVPTILLAVKAWAALQGIIIP